MGDYYMTKTDKYYELTNHLGNVMAVLSDAKHYDHNAQHFTTHTAQAQDYMPFGMLMPGRKYTNTSLVEKYRYGFNGKELDNETSTYDYGFRIYYSAIAKFLSVDPLYKNYPHNSQYAFAENDVIRSIDIEGKEKKIIVTYVNYGDTKTSDDDITIAQEVYKAHYNIFGFKQRDGDGYRYYLDNTASTYNKGVMTLFMRPEERKHRFKYEDDLFDSESIGQFSSSKIYGDGTLHLVADVTSGIAIGQYEKSGWDRFSSDVVDGYMVYAITDGSGYSGASRNVKSWQRLGDVKAIDFGSFITPKSAFQMNGKVNNFLEAVRNSVGTASNLIDLKTNYVDKIKNQSSNKDVGMNLTHLEKYNNSQHSLKCPAGCIIKPGQKIESYHEGNRTGFDTLYLD